MKHLTLALALGLSAPVFAQHGATDTTNNNPQTRLDEVVIHGNRIRVPFSERRRDIQIITSQEIKNLPVTSINEVLSYISGVDIRQRGPFGTQTDVAIDGGTSEQVLVLINGVKMLDSQTAHNMMNIPVPLSAIHHIEVLRGPAARVYGINALTGAINIVTRQPEETSVYAGVHAGSSFESKDPGDGSGIYAGAGVEITADLVTGPQQHLLSLGHTGYNGQRYNTASENTRLFYQGSYAVNQQHNIQAMAGYARSLFGANGFYAAPGDVNSEELVGSSIFSLSSTHRFGTFTLSPRISDRYGADDYRYFKDDLSKARSLHYTNALMGELNAALETSAGTFGIGWESRFERINSSNIGTHKRRNHGLYAEWKTRIGSRFLSTLGVYANYNSDYRWQAYPGIDLAYLLDAYWKISASLGSGQRIPSFTDLYLNQRPANVGNPSLKSENGWNYEGNVQYRRDDMQFQGGYFYREISDFIDWVRESTDEPYSPVNFGNNTMHGVYARLGQSFTTGPGQSLAYQLSYNYLSPDLKGQNGVQSKYVLESLQHQFIAGMQYRYNAFTLGVQNRLLKRELGSAYNVSDLRMSYQWDHLRISAQATNLFGAVYSEAGAVPMPGRWFGLGLSYQWNPAD